MFTDQLNSMTDLYRFITMDGNQAANFNGGSLDMMKVDRFLQYFNQVYLKLDDYINVETVPTAGFTGITLDSNSNTVVHWKLADYAANSQDPTTVTSSTAIHYDIIQYISSMFAITKGGDLIVTID